MLPLALALSSTPALAEASSCPDVVATDAAKVEIDDETCELLSTLGIRVSSTLEGGTMVEGLNLGVPCLPDTSEAPHVIPQTVSIKFDAKDVDNGIWEMELTEAGRTHHMTMRFNSVTHIGETPVMSICRNTYGE